MRGLLAAGIRAVLMQREGDPPAPYTALSIPMADFRKVIDVNLTGVWKTVNGGLTWRRSSKGLRFESPCGLTRFRRPQRFKSWRRIPMR